MNKLERRKKELAKFKKRLKLMANCGILQIKVKNKWRNATSWDQLLDHYKFKKQACPYKKFKNMDNGIKKIAYKRIKEQLEDIDINVKSRFSDIK